MAEKITLKNTLANLPQKTDVDSIVARDASGNPVFIKKSDLAQVVAGLMPTVTTLKKGFMSPILYNNTFREINNGGDDYNHIFELTNYNVQKNILFATARDNLNVLSCIIMCFNVADHYIISRYGNTMILYYKIENKNRRYFISPVSSFGSIYCSFLTDINSKIELVDVTDSISISELTVI